MPEPPHLLLFDIDGTLVDTGGAGLSAIRAALAELYPSEVAAIGGAPVLSLAGRTDSGIAMEMFSAIGIADTPAERERFYGCYLKHLRLNLGAPGTVGRLLSGVRQLLHELARPSEAGEVLVGLLTGNIAEGAKTKVAYYGIGHHFVFGAYGDDHHDRDRLGPVAVARASAHLGRDLAAPRVTVIGDTPKDIRCAKAIGARAVAVATGGYGEEELLGHAPDELLPDFSDVGRTRSAIEG